MPRLFYLRVYLFIFSNCVVTSVLVSSCVKFSYQSLLVLHHKASCLRLDPSLVVLFLSLADSFKSGPPLHSPFYLFVSSGILNLVSVFKVC